MVDTKRITEVWNKAVDLKSPTHQELKSATGISSFTMIFKDVPDLLYLGENLTATIPLGSAVSDSSRINSIFLVTRDSWFSSNAQIQTENLPDFSLLRIRANESAVSAGSKLRLAGFQKLAWVTEPDRWAIQCDDALAFYFHPSDSNDLNPERSWLAQIEFFYGPHFASAIKPHIQFRRNSTEKRNSSLMNGPTQGCDACKSGANSGTWPPPERIAVSQDGWAFLHKCEICGTFWEFNVREAHPISELHAREEFPQACK